MKPTDPLRAEIREDGEMNEFLQSPGESVRHPNFFIVGAFRSGTTSLYKYLCQHPEIFMPEVKEPSFFCELTPSWATKYREFDAYISLFCDAKDHKAIGEASTPYIVSPESPGRIRKMYPDAKIIIILRNPADRASSLYNLLCWLGFEYVAPFEKALAKENERFENEYFMYNNPFWYYAYLYFHSGLYSAQIERYLCFFPINQLHIILFEELSKDPIKTTRRVCEFLGVDTDFTPDTKVANRSLFPLSVRAQYLMAQSWHSHPLRNSGGSPRLLDKILRRGIIANLRLGRFRSPTFNPMTRRDLLMCYRDDIQKTASLIGHNLDSWLTE